MFSRFSDFHSVLFNFRFWTFFFLEKFHAFKSINFVIRHKGWTEKKEIFWICSRYPTNLIMVMIQRRRNIHKNRHLLRRTEPSRVDLPTFFHPSNAKSTLHPPLDDKNEQWRLIFCSFFHHLSGSKSPVCCLGETENLLVILIMLHVIFISLWSLLRVATRWVDCCRIPSHSLGRPQLIFFHSTLPNPPRDSARVLLELTTLEIIKFLKTTSLNVRRGEAKNVTRLNENWWREIAEID